MNPVPAPCIIDGVEWTVRDSGDPRKAYVDFDSMTMVVPMDGTPTGDMIRAHETAHVAITPRDKETLERLAKEFPNRTLQAVEDCRVYVSLQLAGISTDAGHWSLADVNAIARCKDDKEEQARALLATRGTNDHAKLVKVLPAEIVETTERLYAEYFADDVAVGKLPSWEKTVAMARAVHEQYQGKETESQSEKGVPSDDGSKKDGAAKKSIDVLDPTKPFDPRDPKGEKPKPFLSEDDLTEAEKNDCREVLGRMLYLSNGIPIPNANVKYVTPKLSVVHKGRKGFGNRRVSTDSGSIPRRLSRYAVDSAVFSKTVKKGFGTVLVDCSGSMGLSVQDLEEILDSLPNTTVGAYSGDSDQGQIVILAKEGKRVAEIPYFNCGNVVDLQAVEWLAKQRAPRAWICDGGITGRYDESLAVLHTLKIVRICKLNKIKRYGSLKQLLAGLSARKLESGL